MHCMLTEVFGKMAPRPFRVIIPKDRDRKSGVLYGYSSFDANNLRSAAADYACPLQAEIIPASQIASKLMPASWQTGRLLGFEVLIRPTVRIARGSKHAGKERTLF